jgi:CBS domain-containing protein
MVDAASGLMWIKAQAEAGLTFGLEWNIAMKVKDVMTSPVVSVEPDSPISQAIRIATAH